MRFLPFRAAALALLTFCTPGNNDRRAGAAGGPESGMASDSGAGGMSSQDTMASAGGASAVGESASTSSGAGGAMTATAMLSQVHVANAAEIRLAKKAESSGRSPAVKRIARKLETDHTQNQQELDALAKQVNVTITDAAGGAAPGDTVPPPELAGKTGTAFDRAYLEHEIQDHQSNIDKIQSQMIPAASNPQVKSYLQKTVTAMEGHLKALQQVQQQVKA